MRIKILCLSLIITLSQIASAQDNIIPPSVSAPRAVLLDPKTKQLLFSKAPDLRALQGSVAKLMTAYVTFWAIKEGLVSLDDEVPLSLRDTEQGCSCMKSKTIPDPSNPGSSITVSATQVGETFSLGDLLKVTLSQSTGESTDAVAEHVAAKFLNTARSKNISKTRSEKLMNVFLGLMNKRAKELGLHNSKWLTVHGGDTCDFSIGCNPNCLSLDCNTTGCSRGEKCGGGTTAHDLATLWSALSKINPEFLSMIGDRGPFSIFEKSNPSVPYKTYSHGYGYYPGLDGEKNGSTGSSGGCPDAGCWTAQATRAGRPLIASLLQDESFSKSQIDLASLFRFGYRTVLHPERRGDSGDAGGPIKDHALACNSNACFSAVRSADDSLKLLSWNVDVDQGGITIKATVTGSATGQFGTIADVDLAAQNGSWVVGVVSDSKVKLASFGFENSPVPGQQNIRFRKDTGAVPISGTKVRLLALDDKLLISAITDDNGALRLMSWSVGDDGTLTLKHDIGTAGAPSVLEFAIAGGPASQLLPPSPLVYQVVAATRVKHSNSANQVLRLYSWSVNPQSGAIQFLKSTATTGAEELGSHISVARNGAGKFATAMSAGANNTGTLKVIFWGVNRDGTFASTGNTNAGSESVESTAIAPLGSNADSSSLTSSESESSFMTASSILSGHLRLIAWERPKFSSEGSNDDWRLADSGTQAQGATQVRTQRIWSGSNTEDDYVTAVKTASGNLKLIGWRVGQYRFIDR